MKELDESPIVSLNLKIIAAELGIIIGILLSQIWK